MLERVAGVVLEEIARLTCEADADGVITGFNNVEAAWRDEQLIGFMAWSTDMRAVMMGAFEGAWRPEMLVHGLVAFAMGVHCSRNETCPDAHVRCAGSRLP